MSKFWGGSSSEEESSEEQQESSSSEEVTNQKKSQWLMDSDSDDDNVKRVVKSKHQKQKEELRAAVSKLKSSANAKEWANVQKEFAELNKLLTKSKELVQKEGTPSFYIGVLVFLEDEVEASSKDKDAAKKLTKPNAKGLTAMRQLLRKHNSDYTDKIAAYRKSPPADDGDQEDVDEQPESEEEDFGPSTLKKPVKASAPASKWFSGGDEDEDEEDKDEDEDQADSDEDVKSKWFVKDGGDKKNEGSKTRETHKHDKEGTQKKDKAETRSNRPQKEEKVEWTAAKVHKKLEEVVSLRGRRGTDLQNQITALGDLVKVANSDPSFGPALAAAVSIQLLAAHFDLVQSHNSPPASLWTQCATLFSSLLELVLKHDIKLDPNMVMTVVIECDENGAIIDHNQSVVAGNMEVFFERLDDDLTKMMQVLEAQSPDYPPRLEDEEKLIALALRVQDFNRRRKDTPMLVRSSQRLLQRIYYKSSQHDKLVSELAQFVFENGDERLKARAMLCLIFSHALNDRFHEARDMMLMSHLQDTIHMTQDISTQILFNRTMVQLGLCAFRLGLISEAHACLMDISGKIKELLAQGMTSQRYQERTPEQEKLERARLVPAHMHINQDLIEASHLISAMLLEVPNRASGLPYDKKRPISRAYRRRTEYAERLIFAGPPETVTDVVVAAGMSLSKGDWNQAATLLFGLKVWSCLAEVPRDSVLRMLKVKLQETGLKTYVLTYGHVYETMNLQQLSDLFGLTVAEVHSQLSRLIVSDELSGSIDREANSLIMHRSEPSRLQVIALQYADKASVFVESNERLLDAKAGSYKSGYDKGSRQREGDDRRQRGRPTRGQQTDRRQPQRLQQ